MDAMGNDILTTKDAAQIAGRDRRTIITWIRRGMLPALKLPGGRGQYRIQRDDLEKLVEHLDTPVPYVPQGEADGH